MWHTITWLYFLAITCKLGIVTCLHNMQKIGKNTVKWAFHDREQPKVKLINQLDHQMWAARTEHECHAWVHVGYLFALQCIEDCSKLVYLLCPGWECSPLGWGGGNAHKLLLCACRTKASGNLGSCRLIGEDLSYNTCLVKIWKQCKIACC